MANRIDIIDKTISKLPFVKVLNTLEQDEFSIKGNVEIDFEKLNKPLSFSFEISEIYPFRHYDSESIKFKNVDLIKYGHVMGDGSICIHTSHNINLKKKLTIDFHSLKNWILKYYISNEDDDNYEHIICNETSFKGCHYSYMFTDVEHTFSKDDFGEVSLFQLENGIYKKEGITNYIIQKFDLKNKTQIECNWSEIYNRSLRTHTGVFYFCENPPAVHGRFAFQNWENLDGYLSEDFINHLQRFEKQNLKKFRGKAFPLFLGYKTIGNDIHWQVIILEIGDFPIKRTPKREGRRKTGDFKYSIKSGKIIWGITNNSSYKYFFGRGAFSKSLTEKKILIIGVGALGSMVAKTLTRCGCKNINVADYDIKKPENICRSEYLFNLGVNDKSEEMVRILTAISPFVEAKVANNDYFQTIIKMLYDKKGIKEQFIRDLNKNDLVIDCTTDDDLMYILDSLDLDCDSINLSITNHSKELVCGFNNNIYSFVKNQFDNVLDNDTKDLYNPTGCWDPTFKASYNDISLLVQMALRHINIVYSDGIRPNNFVIKQDDKFPSNLIIEEY